MVRILAFVLVACCFLLLSCNPGSDTSANSNDTERIVDFLRGTWIGTRENDNRAFALLVRGATQRGSHDREFEAFVGSPQRRLNPVETFSATMDGSVLRIQFRAFNLGQFKLAAVAPRVMQGTVTEDGVEHAVTFNLRSRTAWSSYQVVYVGIPPPGRTIGGQTAELLGDTKLQVPNSTVAANRAAYAGLWNGWCGPQAPRSIKVAVEQVSNDDATFVYADGGYGVMVSAAFSVRLTARFEDGELWARLRNGGDVVLRLRDDGYMDFINYFDHARSCYGALARSSP